MKAPESLEATIYGMRHGRTVVSEKNVLRFLHEETQDHAPLSPEGREQVKKSIQRAKDRKMLGSDTVIFSSERDRAIHSAIIAKIILGTEDNIKVTPLLNNREMHISEENDFVHLALPISLSSPRKYRRIHIAEKPFEVSARVMTFVESAQREFRGKSVLLVSHAEPLSIAETSLKRLPIEDRYMHEFNYGEIRPLLEMPRNVLKAISRKQLT